MRFFKYSTKTEDEKENAPQESNPTESSEGFSPFWVKIVCIIAALLVWFYVSGDQSTTTEKEFTGVVIAEPNMTPLTKQDYTILNEYIKTVDVTVTGTRRDISSIKAENIVARIDLSGINSPGEHSVKVDVIEPGNTKIKSVFPSEIRIYVGATTGKIVDVKTVGRNVNMKDSTLKVKQYNHVSNVSVSGPEHEVEKISHAIVEFDLKNEKISRTKEISNVEIKLVDANGNEINSPYITVEPKETDVEIVVNKYVTLPVEPVYSGDFNVTDAGYSQVVEPARIKVFGAPDDIENLKSIGTTEIDRNKIEEEESEYSAQVDIVLPHGVELNGAQPNSVNVTLKREIESKKINVSNVVFINCPTGFVASEREVAFEVELIGNKVDIDRINEDDFYLVGNLSGVKGEGTFEKVKLNVKCNESDILDNGSVSVVGKYTCTVDVKADTVTTPEKNDTASKNVVEDV